MSRASPDNSFLGVPPAASASLMDSVDPRARIAALVVVSVVIAAADRLSTMVVALLLAVLGAAFARLRPLGVIKRLAPVNVFGAVLLLLLPFSTGQSPLAAFGPLHYSQEGLLLAFAIVVKANAMVLWVVVLLGALDVITLGHALRHLHVPEKLTHLLLFTVRYLDVLHGEYVRLRTAMKMRGFRPRVSGHTYRSFGYLVGMLVVRSFDRSERIVAAMKCRGFRGRFYLLDHFAYSGHDVWFVGGGLAVVTLLFLLERA